MPENQNNSVLRASLPSMSQDETKELKSLLKVKKEGRDLTP